MQHSPSRLHTRTRTQAHQERSRCLHIQLRMDRCTNTQAGVFGATCESFASCSHIASLPHTSQRLGSAGLHIKMQHRCEGVQATNAQLRARATVRMCAVRARMQPLGTVGGRAQTVRRCSALWVRSGGRAAPPAPPTSAPRPSAAAHDAGARVAVSAGSDRQRKQTHRAAGCNQTERTSARRKQPRAR